MRSCTGLLRFVVVCLCTCASSAAFALPPDLLVYASMSAFKGDTQRPLNVVLQSFNAPTTSLPTDGGEGFFVLNNTGTICPADDGVVVQTTANGDCYYRVFFGPVHIAWYGATDAAANIASPCYATETAMKACDSAALLKKAFTASRTFGDGGVVTDGRSIVLSNSNNLPEIPATQYLSCSGPPGAQRPQLTQGGSAIQYYTLPNSLILDPGIAGNTIRRDAHTRFKSCIIRPTWYTKDLFFDPNNGWALRTNLSTQYVIDNIEHRFIGTATKCGDVDPNTGQPSTDGEACDMDDVLAIGFDTCDDTANAPRAHLTNLKFECNVGEAVHANGGGLDLHDANVHNFIEAIIKPNGTDISRTEWAITGIADDASNHDEVQITITASASAPLGGDNPILIGGFAPQTLSPPGGSTYIGNNGPPALNGLWNVDGSAFPCTGTCTFDLQGSSWTGPNYTANWNAGSNVLSVLDTSNIRGGQFLCGSSGTPPFCTPPTGFGPQSGDTFTLGQSLVHGALPNSLKITTTPSTHTITSWPQSGVLCMSAGCTAGSEYVAYKLADSSHIQITARGVDGTPQPAGDYAIGVGVVPSAPMVIAPVPSVNKVIVSASATAASTSGGEAAYFLNDHSGTYTAPSNCTTAGSSACVILNTNYRTWTWNPAAGSTPDALLTSSASGGNLGVSLFGVSGNLSKLQAGMKVYDATTGQYLHNASGNPALFVSASGTTVTLNLTPSNPPSRTDTLVFNGCGYPGFPGTGTGTAQPWLGNCTATAYLLYGTIADYGASGVACDSLHSHGWRTYFHTNNGQETVCSKLIFDSGAGGVLDDNDTADPTSIGIWTEGDADKIEFSQGKSEARTPFLNTGDPMNDNVTVSNFNFRTNNDYSVSFGNAATTTLSDDHGGASSAGYTDSTATLLTPLTLTGNSLPNTALYFYDPAAFVKSTNCANNVFANSLCSNLLSHTASAGASPAMSGNLSSGATLVGNDNAGRITLPTGTLSGTSITLTFANVWTTPPSCVVQDSGNAGVHATNATAVDSVTFAFPSTPSGGDVLSYQCLGFR